MSIRALLTGLSVCLAGLAIGSNTLAQGSVNQAPQFCSCEQTDCSGGLGTPGWSDDLHMNLTLETDKYNSAWAYTRFDATDLEAGDLPFAVITDVYVTCDSGYCFLDFTDNINAMQKESIPNGHHYYSYNQPIWRIVENMLQSLRFNILGISGRTHAQILIEINDEGQSDPCCGEPKTGRATVDIEVIPRLFTSGFEEPKPAGRDDFCPWPPQRAAVRTSDDADDPATRPGPGR